jgi:hypothetical protein
MKQVFVCLVMICSLLLAICGCSNDFTLQQEPNLEVPEKPVIIQKEPGENKPEPSYEEEAEDPEDLDLEDTDQEEADEDGLDYPDIEQEETDEDALDYPDIEQEEADEDALDYPDIEQEETDNYEPPELTDFYLFSKKEIHIIFSETVKNVSCTFTPHQEIERIQDGKTVKIYLKENLELHTKFLIKLNVKDDWDNSLSVEVPLFANYWIPEIEINELRTQYDSSKKRVEFIEFKAKSAGNLDGLQLYIMWDAKKPFVYDFPAVDVKLGEYVVVHLRTLENACVNELGEDLSESAGTDASPTARDLWVPTKDRLLHETDIVYLKDANGRIMDAIILNEKPGEIWDKNRAHFAQIAEELYNKGAWESVNWQRPGLLDAVDTSTIKTAATKSISRYEGKENTHTTRDWYITNTGGVTPGLPNK